MPIFEGIEAELGPIDHGPEPSVQNVGPPCPALRGWAKFPIVGVGQHTVAQKEHQIAAALQIALQYAGLAASELGHVAEEHAVVRAQIPVHQCVFRGHFHPYQGVVGRRILRGQGHGQIVGGASERNAGRTPVDAQRANRLPHGRCQIPPVVDLQGVAGRTHFDRVIHRCVETVRECDRCRCVRADVDLLLLDPTPVD